MAGVLSDALEREHRDIDGGIETFTAGLANDDPSPEPLVRAMAGLRRHIYLEEEFLFPPMREAGMTMPLFVMVREHGGLWNAMDDIDRLLAADADAEALLNACRELLGLLDAHNSKEEPVIYSQADTTLGDDASRRLSEFLKSGAMPEGWVCEKAGS